MPDPSPDDAPAAPASYSPAELARRIGVSAPTIQRWVDQGHLRAWKTVGGHRRIDAASAERFIAERAGAALPAGATNSTTGDGRAGDTAAGPAGAPTVLIVDDNEDDRDILSALVEEALPGAVLALAENGFDALIRIGRARPQVLITDIVMPHMDGVEMLRHLCATPTMRPPVVLAVSSRTPQEVDQMGGLPPGVELQSKPVSPAGFIERLRSALGASGASGVPSEQPPGDPLR